MRKIKNNFKKNLTIPIFFDKENLLFYGWYKNYSCIATKEEDGIYVSLSAGTGNVILSDKETQEILEKFDITACDTWEIESPLGNGYKTRYFKSKEIVLS